MPEPDIDPFEHEPLDDLDSPMPPPDRRAVMPYSVSPEAGRSDSLGESDDEEGEGEESQLFPGSGLF